MIRGLALGLALCLIACDRATTPASKEVGVVSYRILGRCENPLALSWRYEAAGAPDGAEGLRELLAAASEAWNETGRVAIAEAAPSTDADIVISWHADCPVDCEPFLEWEGSLAHARGIAGEGEAVVHLDAGRAGDWDADELLRVLVHELGHVLGLGHSDDERSIMYPSSDPRRTRPAESDRHAIECLYGAGGVPGLDRDHASARLDVDGDALEEVLVWRVDASAAPRIQTFHLDESGRVTRSIGPWLSSVDPRREGVSVVALEEGGAALLQLHPNGRYTAWGFDERGEATVPWHRGRPLETTAGPEDLDGDGVVD